MILDDFRCFPVFSAVFRCFQLGCNYYPARAVRALGLLLADGAPTVGRGTTFGHVNRFFFFFFTKTALTRERKVEKSFPSWEMNSLCEGYKQAVDQNWGRMEKIGFFGQKPRFWAQKKCSLLHFWKKLPK